MRAEHFAALLEAHHNRETCVTELFTRDGNLHEGRTETDEKGRVGFTMARPCGRCGGAGGSDKWRHTGWTCFQCNGRRTLGDVFVPLYTRERLDALNATQAKRHAKLVEKAQARAEAERIEADAKMSDFLAQHGALLDSAMPYLERSEFLADVVGKARKLARLTAPQADAIRNTVAKMTASEVARAGSDHVGSIGERITARVTVERVSGYHRRSDFARDGEQWVNVVGMRDDAGNMIVSKSPSFHAEKGAQLTIRATVKEHGEYRGEKQTIVQRVQAA